MTRPSDLFSATPPSALKRTLEGSVSVSESQNTVSSDSSSRGDFSPSIFITVLILTIVLIVSVSLHLLLRFLNRHCKSRNDEDHHEDHQHIESINVSRRISNRRVLPEDIHNENQKLIDSLPLFSFDSITGLKSTTSPDCAVCLSKFEKHDQLRLLPICCHAFHSKCIDTWLLSNRTCPLCRSTVPFDESELYDQKLSSRSSAGNDSFRLEIGSVSRRRMNPADTNTDLQQRSYSMGLFEYLIEDESEVNIVSEPIHQRRYSESNSGLKNDDDDDIRSESVIERRQSVPPPPGDDIAAEIGGGSGRGWLRDYVDKLASSTSSSLSSRTLSFSFRGRNFTGSSRRSEGVSISGRRGDDIDVVVGGGGSFDLEAHKYGEEIGSFLRWLSGV